MHGFTPRGCVCHTSVTEALSLSVVCAPSVCRQVHPAKFDKVIDKKYDFYYDEVEKGKKQKLKKPVIKLEKEKEEKPKRRKKVKRKPRKRTDHSALHICLLIFVLCTHG